MRQGSSLFAYSDYLPTESPTQAAVTRAAINLMDHNASVPNGDAINLESPVAPSRTEPSSQLSNHDSDLFWLLIKNRPVDMSWSWNNVQVLDRPAAVLPGSIRAP